jgi:glycosyltransferase involved in cell wall biosynthesis
MASGAVPVATAVDGCAEVIEDGQSGRLVPPDDPDALAAALVATLSDPAALARLGAGARARVRRDFHQQRMLAEWTALLERLARRQPDGPEGGGCG